MRNLTEYCDNLVVGGGVSGLFTCKRYRDERPHEKTIVLEAEPRVGGRLFTQSVVIGGEQIYVENGGMRYHSGHRSLLGLIDSLSLTDEIIPFRMGSDENIYAMRGHRFCQGDLERNQYEPLARLFGLRSGEVGFSPQQLLRRIIATLAKANDYPADWVPQYPEDWSILRNQFEFDGRLLRDYSFPLLMQRMGWSPSCVQMVIRCVGFDAPQDQPCNAGAALQLMANFSPSARYMTLQRGYESLTHALLVNVRSQGGSVREGYRVTDVTRRSDGAFEITAKNHSCYEHKYVAKRSLILALPQNALDKLVRSSAYLASIPNLVDDISSVVCMPLSKVNLYFDTPWWKESFGILGGGNFTDHPAGQIYTFEPQNAGANGMTLYSDGSRATNFWLHAERLDQLQKVAVEQVEEIFGCKIPAPLQVTHTHWGAGTSMHAGDHLWKVGIDDKSVRARLANPAPGLSVVGEAYSDEQSWVEGALRSVDAALGQKSTSSHVRLLAA